ncbi:hypothetical protein [Dactylosporangium sp. CA-092794]|uniref:hypothetical protein n=1 Tax=Dactylosporangium sp. CA-092794 TaxID=3239929 RepID=UPI003D8DFB56
MDGSAGTHLVAVPAIGRMVRRPQIQLPLDGGSERQFRRFDRSMRIVRWVALLLLVAAASLIVTTATAPGSKFAFVSGAVMAALAFGLFAILLRSANSKPAQYPQIRHGKVILNDVHPETVRQWKLIAGDLIIIDG